MSSLEVEKLEKIFSEKKVLDNICLTVGTGEIFGLLGPSGAGKTTLIKILTGQLKYGGVARVFGRDCSKFGNEIYSKVGMVLDNCGVYERLNCYDNMKLFAQIYKVDNQRVHSVLKKVGLSGALKTPARLLSKGMRQRLLLARSILHKPEILFLDEPTSGLDPATAQEIHEYLNELRNAGTTIFLTTHNMEEAYRLCDNIALLNEGRIVEYGVPGELCRKYNRENTVEIILKSGETIRIPNSAASAGEIASYFREDRVAAIHSSEPNLGTVFMKLTGRGLNV